MPSRLRMGEAAQRLGLSQDTVREWVRRGFLRAHRTPTGQLLFDAADVESARQGDQPPPTAQSAAEPAVLDLPGESKEASPWKKLPPWVTKVETARASLTVDELEAERSEKAMAREIERKRTIAAEQRADQARAELQRLNGVKKRVIQAVWIPSEYRSEVIASIERFATREQLPSWLAEWEQFNLLAAHARALVEKLSDEEQQRSADERAKEQKRLDAEYEQQRQEFAAKLATALEPKHSQTPSGPQSVAEALRRRRIIDE